MARAATSDILIHVPGGLQVRALRNLGPLENNVFVVSDEGSGEAYVLDGGYEPEAIASVATGLRVQGILVTHGHRDHHEHVAELKRLLDAPVGIGEADAALLSVPADFVVHDGETYTFGVHTLRALHTPGHTPGSTCFLLDEAGYLFTGDTLFPGGPGNTRQDPAAFAQVIESIRTRLFTLPPETVVCPGHGRDTTIGAEQPQLDAWIRRGW